jgi:hypothetical protein
MAARRNTVNRWTRYITEGVGCHYAVKPATWALSEDSVLKMNAVQVTKRGS